MAITNKSNTEASIKNYWRTSPEIIEDALKLLNIESFDLDVCAKNSTVRIKPSSGFISEDEDALKEHTRWFRRTGVGVGSVSFCNPPFSLKYIFFKKAVEQVNTFKGNVLMVMPYTPITKEWRENVSKANCVIYRPDGRYQFLLPDGTKPNNSCSFETCLILIVPFKLGCVTVDYKRGLDG